ncbi:IS110 family transposase [Ornithinimicrobium cryptoxanthini]|uniref:Transposase n=1 Tax=Ornithinimicrobium cryptoxanthini TaxID=2934161 RepID=A0ABY4YN58_9MICO|nr:transposase [Ornithinimicrobium cryptoxanthini]USQ77778.1 transposase [Ornithinimicrobium cryptoxanthini]
MITQAGHRVMMVEPAAFKAARPPWGSAGAKSDSADAFMLADYARTDNHRLRRVEPVAQPTRELAALVRARTALVQARAGASNQLWAILAEHWPGAALIFQKLTSPIALAFLADYPAPQSARHLGEGRMRQFCHRHSYRGGESPAELVQRLRAAPVSASAIAPSVLTVIVGASIIHIRMLNGQIVVLEQQIATALAAHPKTSLLQTLPRTATVSLARLIAEIGPLLERCDNPEQVAALCSAAPVTKASGKSRTVGFRYTANKQARVAITSFADNSRHSSAGASDCYRRARAHVEPAIRTRSGSWPGAASVSSGPAGPPTPCTTRIATAASNDSASRLPRSLKRRLPELVYRTGPDPIASTHLSLPVLKFGDPSDSMLAAGWGSPGSSRPHATP